MKQALILIISVIIFSACSGTVEEKGSENMNLADSNEQPDYTSKVPQFTYPNTLEEQEEALKSNPLLQRFRESRKKLAEDPHLPLYHFVSPENRLNDPNGLCFWQGRCNLLIFNK